MEYTEVRNSRQERCRQARPARPRAATIRCWAAADINLYSLFVERAMSLIKPDGLVGLLTPSGIYADKTAARFFKSVSTKGRVSGLFDFENKKIFFKDVHASFKFCALIFGGHQRTLRRDPLRLLPPRHVRTIDDRDRCFPLTPGRLRPRQPQHRHRARLPHDAATPTSPAASTSGIPCSWTTPTAKSAAPGRFRFMQGMFNMTSDSHLFRTAVAARGRRASIRSRATAGSGAKSCICRSIRGVRSRSSTIGPTLSG